LPYGLAFAAAAMLFVNIEKVIPETQQDKNIDSATFSCFARFIVMMPLDVALGEWHPQAPPPQSLPEFFFLKKNFLITKSSATPSKI
jgi:hypothetical protein